MVMKKTKQNEKNWKKTSNIGIQNDGKNLFEAKARAREHKSARKYSNKSSHCSEYFVYLLMLNS